jgi:ribosomal protein S18 acetylase RimI-like enzyme
MSPRFRLVPIEAQERGDFLAMAEQHFRELNPTFTPARDWNDSYFENIKENPKYSLRWIVVDGQHVGFIIFGVEEHRFLPRKSGAIYELYVIPERRKKGIARACAEQVIEELQQFSISKIQLEVTEGNLAASELWRSLGFRKVTERLVLTTKAT